MKPTSLGRMLLTQVGNQHTAGVGIERTSASGLMQSHKMDVEGPTACGGTESTGNTARAGGRVGKGW